jgi:threonine synthase
MRDYTVRCVVCPGTESYPAYRCWACAAPLVLDLAPAECAPTTATGVWRYAGMLPRTTATVTLGEGSTPLLPWTSDRCVKLESLNPSLSFKDRAMALAAAAALDLGLDGLVLASTGNAAVSAATYAAAAGLRCKVFCATGSNAGPSWTPPGRTAPRWSWSAAATATRTRRPPGRRVPVG